jgi:antitoxin component YwqK of YwqJK toxin-antitoxin module
MLKVEHPCPNGCKEIIEPWGGVDISGLMRFCAKNVESSRRNVKHGKWVVWVNTKVRIDGFYNEGKKDGRLTYYNNDGSTLSIVEYRNGVKVSEKQNEDI